MDDGFGQVCDVMEKLMVDDLRYLMSCRYGLCPIDAEPHLGE